MNNMKEQDLLSSPPSLWISVLASSTKGFGFPVQMNLSLLKGGVMYDLYVAIMKYYF